MPTLSAPSPVAEAISRTLELFHPDRATRTSESDGKDLVLSYRETGDFAFLWNFWEDDGVESTVKRESAPNGKIISWALSGDEPKNIVVVWDGIPRPSIIGNVYLGNYLTAFDWLISFNLALTGFDCNAARPKLRISIIDLVSTGEGLSESALLFRQLQYGATPLLDGVHVYKPAANDNAERDVRRFVADSLPYAFSQREQILAGEVLQPGLAFPLLRRIWRARLLAPANPRDRHAIANLLGPQLLISAMSSWSATSLSRNSPCLAALRSLMRIFGLFPRSRESVRLPWVGPDKWKNVRLDATEMGPVFVLVDDMHHLGWADFLRLALGNGSPNEDTVTLIVNESPQAKGFGPSGMRTLFDLLEDETGHLNVNKGIDLTPGREAILFLDLRLFNDRTVRSEIEFFKSLLVLARQVDEDSNRKDLPWKGFMSQEIRAVESIVTSEEVESDDYLVALTLLPRLIALVDPMLPIVLFSSTGQRRISEALKGYGNIISDFDKPRFFGEASGSIVESTRQRFEQAVSRALTLLRGRLVCRHFKVVGRPTATSKSEPYVEIFIDEAGEVSEHSFRVGGVAIIYDDENQAEGFNVGMVSAGLTWGSTNIELNPSTLIAKRLPRAEDYQTTIYDPVDRLLQAAEIKEFIGFSLTVSPDRKWIDSTDLTSPWCLDNLYRGLLGQSLEALFYEVLPEKIGQDIPRFRCAVYVATRKRCQSDADAPRDWAHTSELNIHRRYGIRIRRDDDCENGLSFQSITSENVYPIVAQVRARMPAAEIRVLIARGSQLRYGVDTSYPESLPRPAHLLADPVISFSGKPEDIHKQPSLNRWLASGFNSVADDQFIATLRACHHARKGRYVEAILEAYRAVNRRSDVAELDSWARARIGRSVDRLSGLDFMELCSRLPGASSESAD